MQIVKCPYCLKQAEYVTSKEFYGQQYKNNLYVCYPCDARVGTHGKGKRPLGTMANKQLRALRMSCHQVFDNRWKNKKRGKSKARKKAYLWLQEAMNLSEKEAHIGKFNKEQCFKLLEIMRNEEVIKC